MLDLMGQGNDVDSIPHFRDKGLNTLYSDGSVVFSKAPAVWKLVSSVAPGQAMSTSMLEHVCNLLEQ